MPISIDDETLFVLASALVVAFDWATPFWESSLRWGERWVSGLGRRFVDRDLASVIGAGAGSIGRFVSVGAGETDVHLLTASADLEPGAVLAGGIAALADATIVRSGSSLQVGDSAGGLVVSVSRSADGAPFGWISLPPFTVSSDHDLTTVAAVLGLASALDADAGHFPGIADDPPLAIGAANQTISASFSKDGFVAAAVTSFMGVAGAGAPPESATCVGVNLDRPFGFLAVNRVSGLVLAAGWVTEPNPIPEEYSVSVD